MTQKQILGVVVGVALVIVVSVFVYRQYTGDMGNNSNSATTQKKMTEKKAPVPETVDGVVDSIVDETTLDTTALDDETTASLEELDADNESVNNLGTSYDENSL